MNKIEELKERQAKEIEKLEKEESIRLILPPSQHDPSIYQHSDYASVTHKLVYPNLFSLNQARKILNRYKEFIIESEHWKSGCISCLPAEINKYSKEERAVLDGQSYAELLLYAGPGFNSHSLNFWAKIQDHILSVSIEIRPPWKLLPHTDFRYDSHGDCIKSEVVPKGIGEDTIRKFWSAPGGYRISYYWADRHNWEAWIFHTCATNNDAF